MIHYVPRGKESEHKVGWTTECDCKPVIDKEKKAVLHRPKRK